MDIFLRIAGGLCSRWRRLVLGLRGMRFEGSCRLEAIDVPRLACAVTLGNRVALDKGVTLILTQTKDKPRIKIGARSYINRYTILDASNELTIGDDCMIGPFCYITDHDHTFGADGRPASGGLTGKPTRIGNNCWIGASVILLKGVEIGDGVVIGAGAVVTESIPTGMVAVGNPAHVVHAVNGGKS